MKTRIVNFLWVLGIMAFAGVFALTTLNHYDTPVDKKTLEILTRSTDEDLLSKKECGSLLGIAVAPELNFQIEGERLLSLMNNEQFYQVPKEIKGDFSKIEGCKDPCLLPKESIRTVRGELAEKELYLQRFDQLVQLKGAECRNPLALKELPLLALLKMTRWKLHQLSLWMTIGQGERVVEELVAINDFFVASLDREKLGLHQSLAFVAIIQKARESLVKLPKIDPKVSKWTSRVSSDFYRPLSFKEIARRTEIGEMQILNVRLHGADGVRKLNGPLTKRTLASIGSEGFLESFIQRVAEYLFLPQSTLTEAHQQISGAAAHPCIRSKTKKCPSGQRHPFEYIYNPAGKYLIDSGVAKPVLDGLQKLNKNISKVRI
ncbi:MAG: hypothetical protein RJB66_212 [Pseudomonadota bacterium]|jgi:hypothetical protein